MADERTDIISLDLSTDFKKSQYEKFVYDELMGLLPEYYRNNLEMEEIQKAIAKWYLLFTIQFKRYYNTLFLSLGDEYGVIANEKALGLAPDPKLTIPERVQRILFTLNQQPPFTLVYLLKLLKKVNDNYEKGNGLVWELDYNLVQNNPDLYLNAPTLYFDVVNPITGNDYDLILTNINKVKPATMGVSFRQKVERKLTVNSLTNLTFFNLGRELGKWHIGNGSFIDSDTLNKTAPHLRISPIEIMGKLAEDLFNKYKYITLIPDSFKIDYDTIGNIDSSKTQSFDNQSNNLIIDSPFYFYPKYDMCLDSITDRLNFRQSFSKSFDDNSDRVYKFFMYAHNQLNWQHRTAFDYTFYLKQYNGTNPTTGSLKSQLVFLDQNRQYFIKEDTYLPTDNINWEEQQVFYNLKLLIDVNIIDRDTYLNHLVKLPNPFRRDLIGEPEGSSKIENDDPTKYFQQLVDYFDSYYQGNDLYMYMASLSSSESSGDYISKIYQKDFYATHTKKVIDNPFIFKVPRRKDPFTTDFNKMAYYFSTGSENYIFFGRVGGITHDKFGTFSRASKYQDVTRKVVKDCYKKFVNRYLLEQKTLRIVDAYNKLVFEDIKNAESDKFNKAKALVNYTIKGRRRKNNNLEETILRNTYSDKENSLLLNTSASFSPNETSTADSIYNQFSDLVSDLDAQTSLMLETAKASAQGWLDEAQQIANKTKKAISDNFKKAQKQAQDLLNEAQALADDKKLAQKQLQQAINNTFTTAKEVAEKWAEEAKKINERRKEVEQQIQDTIPAYEELKNITDSTNTLDSSQLSTLENKIQQLEEQKQNPDFAPFQQNFDDQIKKLKEIKEKNSKFLELAQLERNDIIAETNNIFNHFKKLLDSGNLPAETFKKNVEEQNYVIKTMRENPTYKNLPDATSTYDNFQSTLNDLLDRYNQMKQQKDEEERQRIEELKRQEAEKELEQQEYNNIKSQIGSYDIDNLADSLNSLNPGNLDEAKSDREVVREVIDKLNSFSPQYPKAIKYKNNVLDELNDAVRTYEDRLPIIEDHMPKSPTFLPNESALEAIDDSREQPNKKLIDFLKYRLLHG